MSKRKAILYFQDILTSLENIEEYTKGLDLENFKRRLTRIEEAN